VGFRLYAEPLCRLVSQSQDRAARRAIVRTDRYGDHVCQN
jgi:hypothetical protein